MARQLVTRPPMVEVEPRPTGPASPAELLRLRDELRPRVEGEVRFDTGSRALYATDSSNYRQVPLGVVLPRDAEDVTETLATCRRYGAPVLGRGGGTSLAGQCCNAGVVLDFSKYMHGVLDIDPSARLARVLPGTALDDLRNAAKRHGLTFGPDPATHDHCTLGGMIGNNSCGVHSVMAGRTAENVEELEILTYDGVRMRVGQTSEDDLRRIIAGGGRQGEIYSSLKDLRDHYADLIRQRFPDIPRRVSGYGLDQLLPENGFNVARALVGSESTCVLVLEATLRLIPWPAQRALLVLGFGDVATAADNVPLCMEHSPIGLEGLDQELTELATLMNVHPNDVKMLPKGSGWLLVEFGGDTEDEAAGKARGLMDALGRLQEPPATKLLVDDSDQERLWKVRESGLGATTFLPGPAHKIAWPGWEDSAVPPDRLGDYLREFRMLLDRYEYDGSLYGHFGQGCLHTSTDFELATAPGIRKFRSFIEDAADLVIRFGGSLSGEHGDGQARGELLGKMFGSELVEAFREFKRIWDPDGKMNPGKIVDPFPLDSNLRLGTDYNPPDPGTHFAFPADFGSFARATLRCVGIGECRKTDSGTMCPSYMVTREEMHATRGRARLLFEMMKGETLRDGWKSPAVKESLDLCLACKGCKGDCPVNVDMATYKAEFLSHYYEGRLRPRSAYAFGLIFRWARLAALAPGLVNLVGRLPVVSRLVKRAIGMAPEREIPRFASATFRDRWQARRKTVGAPEVILWPDTFNNYFHPETAEAAARVLEASGFNVRIPERVLCCGRPLYDYGMLDTARTQLEEILSELRDDIRAGVPVVGLEPSCVAVFRDELPNLFPNDEDARRLHDQTFMLGEFLERHPDALPDVSLERKAVVHGHCHHKSVLDFGSEESLVKRLGLDASFPDSGCCGMAGSFGFEAGERYRVSVAAGERVLLPAVRQAAEGDLVIADGFSCREQIRQQTGRRALHIAEVLDQALGPSGVQAAEPVRPTVSDHAGFPAALVALAFGYAAGAGVAATARRIINRRGARG